MGIKKSNMKTQNATLIAIARNIHAAANINVLFRSDAAARRNDYYIDTQKSLFAQIAGLPVDSVEEEAAKLVAIALMPEPQPVRRMARPLPVKPVVAPKLALTGVEPVTVKSWSPSRGEFDEVIGYNVIRVIDGKEDVQFRPRANSVAPQVAVMADWSPKQNVEVSL